MVSLVSVCHFTHITTRIFEVKQFLNHEWLKNAVKPPIYFLVEHKSAQLRKDEINNNSNKKTYLQLNELSAFRPEFGFHKKKFEKINPLRAFPNMIMLFLGSNLPQFCFQRSQDCMLDTVIKRFYLRNH